MLSINVQDTPLHVVVWKGQESSTAEITQLKKRIEDLEALVRSLVGNQTANAPLTNHTNADTAVIMQETKPKKSPFFKSTSVPEPIGLSVLTNLNLDNDNVSTADSSVNEAEVFDKLVNEPSSKPASAPVITVKEKRVDLNGMTFVVRKWGEDIIYCEENSGRAYLDPKDAFHEPEKHHIGYWNSEAETVSVRSEEEAAEEEQQNQLEQQEEEEEEEEEEEGVELEEITYKGKTYYRDGDNQVYQPNDEGEVDTEKPYGVWDEAKQKVLKYSQ